MIEKDGVGPQPVADAVACIHSARTKSLARASFFAIPSSSSTARLRLPPFCQPSMRRRGPVFLLLLLAAAAVAPAVHSFPFRLQPWKKQVGHQHQATERRRRPPGLSGLFGANDNEGSDENVGSNDKQRARSGPAPVSPFEEMVRKMTNNPEYKVRRKETDDTYLGPFYFRSPSF